MLCCSSRLASATARSSTIGDKAGPEEAGEAEAGAVEAGAVQKSSALIALEKEGMLPALELSLAGGDPSHAEAAVTCSVCDQKLVDAP